MCVCVHPQRLSELYYDIHRSYLKVTEVVNSEKRLFGRYYRVAFYGQVSEQYTHTLTWALCTHIERNTYSFLCHNQQDARILVSFCEPTTFSFFLTCYRKRQAIEAHISDFMTTYCQPQERRNMSYSKSHNVFSFYFVIQQKHLFSFGRSFYNFAVQFFQRNFSMLAEIKARI